MDVHQEAVVIAVLNDTGKLVMESTMGTEASSLVQFIHGMRGELYVTWEEGTWAASLYELLKPHVQQVLVCDPRRNALLQEGNKSDQIDARKLADWLRTGMLRPVYPGEHGQRTLRELARSYQTVSQDLNRPGGVEAFTVCTSEFSRAKNGILEGICRDTREAN